MYLRGIILFLIGLFWIAMMGADYNLQVVRIFIDMPTTCAFIVTIAAVITITGNFKTFIMAVNALLSRKYRISNADREKALKLFRLLEKSVICESIIFTIMGIMLLLNSLSDPDVLGPALSVSLTAMFQGAIINLIFIYPAINVLETRRNVDDHPVVSEKQVIDKMLELCYKQGVSPDEILNADEISFRRYQ